MSDSNKPTESSQPSQRRRRSRKRGKDKSQKPIAKKAQPLDNTPLGKLRRLFIGCPRCSYFLTGYQAYEGLTHLEEVAEQEEEILTLHWNAKVHHLIEKSFGGSIDHGAIFYSISCPMCHRQYNFDGREEDQQILMVQAIPE